MLFSSPLKLESDTLLKTKTSTCIGVYSCPCLSSQISFINYPLIRGIWKHFYLFQVVLFLLVICNNSNWLLENWNDYYFWQFSDQLLLSFPITGFTMPLIKKVTISLGYSVEVSISLTIVFHYPQQLWRICFIIYEASNFRNYIVHDRWNYKYQCNS